MQANHTGYERIVTDCALKHNITNKHMFCLNKLAVIYPPTLITLEILFWPDIWFEMTEIPGGNTP